MEKLVAFTVTALILVALCTIVCGCDAFAPKIDPTPYPCHDPRMHYCASGRTCCFDNEACEENPPRCAYVGPAGGARDAGADAR